MEDLLKIKIKNKITSHRYSWHYYKAIDDGKNISLGEFDSERTNFHVLDCSEEYKQEIEQNLKTFSDFIRYEIDAYNGSYINCITPVNIGDKKEISKDTLYKLFKKENKTLTRKEFDKFTFTFHATYPNLDDYYYYKSSAVVEKAKGLISDKKNLEYVIKNLNNKKLSNLNYLKKLEAVYDVNRDALLEIAQKKYFKNPVNVTINTSLKGSPSLTVYGYGYEFSYMHDTTESFNFYVEDGTFIDTKKVYSKEELLQLKKETNALITSNAWNNRLLFFDKTELAEIVRENVSKAKLFDDYLTFLNYYKFATLDISTALQKRKNQEFQKIDELKQKINNIDNTIKELDENCTNEL